MENKFDIGQFVNTLTEQSVINGLVERVKKKRKQMKLSQKLLSQKSGVTYASIRRFETTGEISLSSLLKIAHALDSLKDFEGLFKGQTITNLKDYEV
ncbi:MAG: helix-turn-helix transcriptional regulator [Clostridia bacterium]|nr:helix-turn-helix transcriptional regulator [Clostridia bacterium]